MTNKLESLSNGRWARFYSSLTIDVDLFFNCHARGIATRYC